MPLAGRRAFRDDCGKLGGFMGRSLIIVQRVWCRLRRLAKVHRRHDLPWLDADGETADICIWKTNDFWLFLLHHVRQVLPDSLIRAIVVPPQIEWISFIQLVYLIKLACLREITSTLGAMRPLFDDWGSHWARWLYRSLRGPV